MQYFAANSQFIWELQLSAPPSELSKDFFKYLHLKDTIDCRFNFSHFLPVSHLIVDCGSK